MAVLWPPSWISCWYRCRALAVIAPLFSPHSRPSISPLESCRYLNFWQSYKYFQFRAVLWPPSWISCWYWCRALAVIVPLCSPLLKTLVSALESRRYLNYWQSYKHFQFIPFVMAAILNFLLILISRISADCSIVFPTSKNLGVAVGIALLSHFLAKLPVLPFFPVFQPPSWIFHWCRCHIFRDYTIVFGF